MVIYPAIDLLDGPCVRLRQGRYDDVTVYGEDPAAVALRFKKAGAAWLHVVGLEAARTGIPSQTGVIEKIRRESGLLIQMGGGVRTFQTLAFLLNEIGVERVVLGTIALTDPSFARQALARYADRIVIAIDARDGRVAADGWTKESDTDALSFALAMKKEGAQTVFTRISGGTAC